MKRLAIITLSSVGLIGLLSSGHVNAYQINNKINKKIFEKKYINEDKISEEEFEALKQKNKSFFYKNKLESKKLSKEERQKYTENILKESKNRKIRDVMSSTKRKERIKENLLRLSKSKLENLKGVLDKNTSSKNLFKTKEDRALSHFLQGQVNSALNDKISIQRIEKSL